MRLPMGLLQDPYDSHLEPLESHYRYYYDCLMRPNAKSVSERGRGGSWHTMVHTDSLGPGAVTASTFTGQGEGCMLFLLLPSSCLLAPVGGGSRQHLAVLYDQTTDWLWLLPCRFVWPFARSRTCPTPPSAPATGPCCATTCRSLLAGTRKETFVSVFSAGWVSQAGLQP